MLFHIRKRTLDFTIVAGCKDRDLDPKALRSREHGVTGRGVWRCACQEGNCRGARNQFMQKTQSLFRKLRLLVCHARDVAAGPAEAINETILHRVATIKEHDWDHRGSGLCRTHGGDRIGNEYHVHSAFDEFRYVCGKPRKLRWKLRRKFKIDRYVLTNDQALIGEALSEIGYRKRQVVEPKNPNHRHSSLRAHGERPHRRAPEPRDELPSSHSMTSSAVANSVSGMV